MRNPISRGRFTYNLGQLCASTPALATITGPDEPAPPPKPVVQAAPALPVRPNHQQRRRNAAINRLLARRLAKEKVPVKVEILPDGGVHVTADMREEKA